MNHEQMQMEFVRKLPIPQEIKKQFPISEKIALLDQLAEVSGMPAPQPLATLKDKQVRFTSWTEKEQMRAVVTDFLK